MISIILPVLNEETVLARTFNSLASWQAQGCEVIVVDGGSTDSTVSISEQHADQVLKSVQGRAVQLNTGAQFARGDMLLFLHADTQLPEFTTMLCQTMMSGPGCWGRFDLTLSGKHPLFRIIGFFINMRSRLSGIATGDQAIFLHKQLFLDSGGFPEIPLMEDIAFCKKLRTVSRPVCLKERVITSSRRWEQQGIVRTVLMMWYLRCAWYLGAKPERLARIYAG